MLTTCRLSTGLQDAIRTELLARPDRPALAAAFVENAKLVERLEKLAGRVRAAAAPSAGTPGGDGQEVPLRKR
jgi:hypothetical protein